MKRWSALALLVLIAAAGAHGVARAGRPVANAGAASAPAPTRSAGAVRAQSPPASTDEPAVPAPTGFVNDAAGVLDEATRARLEAFLDQVKVKTGAEFAVLIVRSTAPLAPSEYKTRVFQSWGIGRRGEDNGLLMLVAMEEREVRFETGYGLEGTLPDGLQSRIFRQEMAPRFRQDDYAGGIIAGVQAASARIAREKGVTLEWDGRELRYDEYDDNNAGIPPWAVALVILVIVIMISAIAGSSRGRRRSGWGDDFWGGGFGGWGGGGFGGFGGLGGGGRGGGFGGFGGGASGGGGGGGKW